MVKSSERTNRTGLTVTNSAHGFDIVSTVAMTVPTGQVVEEGPEARVPIAECFLKEIRITVLQWTKGVSQGTLVYVDLEGVWRSSLREDGAGETTGQPSQDESDETDHLISIRQLAERLDDTESERRGLTIVIGVRGIESVGESPLCIEHVGELHHGR